MFLEEHLRNFILIPTVDDKVQQHRPNFGDAACRTWTNHNHVFEYYYLEATFVQ